MRVHFGADHAGFDLKEHLLRSLEAAGHEVFDHGAFSRERVDYPDFAAAVARAVGAGVRDADGRPPLGILVCGSGIGVSITANRFPGIRAVTAALEAHAVLARAHTDANILCLGGRITAAPLAERLVELFLSTPFEGGRHIARVARIDAIARDIEAISSKPDGYLSQIR